MIYLCRRPRFCSLPPRCTPKVTPYAGARIELRDSWGWRTYLNPHRAHLAQRQKDLARWKKWAILTEGRAKSISTTIGAALGRHLRLIDKNGREYGPRYQSTRKVRPGDHSLSHDDYQLIDPKGKTIWLPGNTRCRIVQRQSEDPHSAACRALKRAHRLGVSE